MPILVGCGCAAGISAFFNAPIGGVRFALEVILQDFSLRTFTPVVVASVIANITTRAIFLHLNTPFDAIFASNVLKVAECRLLDWGQVLNFIVLGLICGAVGVALSRTMYLTEERFAHLKRLGVWRPAIGGALLGVLGVLYILIFGYFLAVKVPIAGQPGGQATVQAERQVEQGADRPAAEAAAAARRSQLRKPFGNYSMPAFYGDGYDVIRGLLDHRFYAAAPGMNILLLLVFLCAVKVVGTCLTLGSGGSGGIIAPSLFLGATAGAIMGILLQRSGWFPHLQPELYALVGMGAVLAAVVHAPLASILICFEVTEDYKVMVPAMLACVFATGFARLLFRDSIYTLTLRLRGVRVGTNADLTLLRRLTAEQVDLEPATLLRQEDPFQKVLDIANETGASDFVVVDKTGNYLGMVVADDINTALLQREAVPLLLVGEIMRPDIPAVRSGDDLLSVLDTFNRHEISRLPVCINGNTGRIIGLISRSALMKRQQQALAEM
jgi:CIC family chloride channel protein